MATGDLVFATVVDARVYQAQGADAPPGVYLVATPGRALPFVVHRAWKAPTGYVAEEFRLIAPSGRVAYRWGPNPRRMLGAMDLTVEAETITDAVLSETGTYVASFILDNWLVGEIEVPAWLQEGQEWEQAAALLADRRRDRHGPPGDAIERWRESAYIAELIPVVAG